jgi:hypothetical protein
MAELRTDGHRKEGILIYLPAEWRESIANKPADGMATLMLKSRLVRFLHGFDGPIGSEVGAENPQRSIFSCFNGRLTHYGSLAESLRGLV